MDIKTERIALLSSPAFKAFLAREAKTEGISVSELVRRRCARAPTEDERALLALADDLCKATGKAHKALRESLAYTQTVLAEVNGKPALRQRKRAL